MTKVRAALMLAASTLVTGLLPRAAVAQQNEVMPSAGHERSVMVLANGWRFHPGDSGEASAAAGFNDSDWAQVSVPHSWNRVGYYRVAPASHFNRADNVDKTQGVGWYRLRFTPAADPRNTRTWLEFDAASRIASVWLNGRKIGDHAGGFSRFRVDATDALKPGQENLLAVRVDNSAPSTNGSATADVLPLTGDFFVHGGLYRPVRLVTTNAVHFDMADFGGPGVLATTASATASNARVAVRARITNDGSSRSPVGVVARLIDAAGKTAATAKQRIASFSPGTTEATLAVDVNDPHLWQGVDDPYLYTLEITITDARGRTVDRVRQPFGIRTIAVDPDKGLFLNGKHIQLRGVGYHQDREGKGWAVDPADTASDLAIMREMGVNTIRLTHYQHGQTIHDLADRYGILLWDEIPLVSAWTRRAELEPRAALIDNAKQQLRELIRQNGNHASVINWGIANEVDFGNSFPAFLTGYPNGKTPDPMPLLNMLQKLAHDEDPSRPTALATCCEGRLFDQGVDIPTTAEVADLGGANRYFGWYFGVADDFGPQLDALHAKRPRQPLSVTEYGAGAATSIHTDDVHGGPIDSRGANQPEEYASYIHEEAWKVIQRRPYLWATWLWNSFDFATTFRVEGDAQDINTKGLVTYDRAIRKDPFYFYKANWTATPTVHITERRYVERNYSLTDIRVYSNAPATDLLLNGRSLGVRNDCADRVCVWKGVALAEGDNRIVANGQFGSGTVADQVDWTVSRDVIANVRIDAGAIVAPPAGSGPTALRFGSDAFFTGGTAGTLNKPADYGKPAVAATIAGAANPAVAATYRQGRFGYRVPLSNGRYRVAFTFVEPSLRAGERVFDVIANGRPIIKALDIARVTGGAAVALRREVTVDVKGGELALNFVPTRGDAVVSAVEITEAARGAR